MREVIRPKAVEFSVFANAAVCAAGIIKLFVTKGGVASATALCVWAIFSWLVFLLLRSIWRGRKWTWWLIVILTAIGLALLPWTTSDMPTDFYGRILYIAQGVIGTIATLLLLPRKSREWFGLGNSFNSTTLRDAP